MLAKILLNSGCENIIEAALGLYDEILREKRSQKGTSLSSDEVRDVIAGMYFDKVKSSHRQ